jgi:CobQ-like glutamine amidotransferase family enzyme
MKIIEFLYPEYTNIYGESYNLEYLKRCNKEIQVLETHVGDTPKFIYGQADMVYMGCMTEDKQEKTIELLMPYRNMLIQAIQSGVIFLVTGNAIEMFGTKIEGDDVISDERKDIQGLCIFDFKSVRSMNAPRHNSQYIGNFNGILMLGHRSQYSFSYGDFENNFIRIYKGIGMNPDTDKEGIHVKNFFGTYSLGPYFIMNPPFTKYILRLLGLKDDLIFEKEIMEAYQYRLEELRRTI